MSKTIIKHFIHYIYMNEMCIMYTQRISLTVEVSIFT